MPASPVQLIGGNFEDAQGNLLALGYLKMKLSQDEEVNDSLICSGIEITIQLDVNGSVVTSPPQYVWGNDQMLPVNSFYQVTGYTAKGQPVFGPNNQQVLGSGGTFDVGTWIPNLVVVWVPPLQPLDVEVNGTPSSSQTILDFVDSSTVTWTNSPGGIVEAHSSTGLSIEENGNPTSDQTVADFTDTPSVHWSNPSGGQIEATVQPLGYLPQPDVRMFSYWAPLNAALGGWYALFDGLTAGGGGVFTPASASKPAVLHYIALSGANGNPLIWPTRTLTFKTAIYASPVAGSAGVRYFGLSNAGSSPNDPTGAGIDSILVGVDQSVSGLGNWLLITNIGGSTNIVDSGIPVASGLRHQVQIVVMAGVARLSVDGVGVASSSVLPTANPLSLLLYIQRTTGFGDISTDVEYMYCEYSQT